MGILIIYIYIYGIITQPRTTYKLILVMGINHITNYDNNRVILFTSLSYDSEH